jgi:hypothetical protein
MTAKNGKLFVVRLKYREVEYRRVEEQCYRFEDIE